MESKKKLRNAEEMAGMWLHRGNLASERGNRELAERHYQRAQKWMDAMNRLLGNGDGSENDIIQQAPAVRIVSWLHHKPA